MKQLGNYRGTSLGTARTLDYIVNACTGGLTTAFNRAASIVIIQPMTKGIYVTDTGTAPDISDLTDTTKVCGLYIAANEKYVHNGDLTKIKILEESASASVNLAFYSEGGI